MKKMKFLVAIIAVLMAIVACEPIDPNQGQGGDKPTTGTDYGKGTEAEPYTVAGVVKTATGEAWVKGYIVGFMQTGDSNYPVFSAETDTINTNILLADSIGDEENYIAVQLPKGDVRNGLNLVDNKGNLNQEVLVYGTITNYFGATGLKGVSYAKLGESEFGNKPADVNDVIFTQSFKQSFGDFIEYSVSGDEKWYIDTKYGYAMITGYINGTNNANEDWLISPAISLEGVTAAKMNIEHVLRYNNKPAEAATIWVSENYTEGDPNNATWTQLPTNFTDASDWTISLSKDLDLNAFLGKTVRIALKYVATTTKAGTWEVKTFNVLKGQAEVDPGTGNPDGPADGDAGSETQPYTVAQAISNQGAKDNGVYVWAEGYIVGVYGNSKAPVFGADALTEEQPYNVLIADAADDYVTTVCVQLPAGVLRDGINLVDNGANLGKKLKVQGTLEPYNSMAGIKNAKVAYLDGVKVEEKPLDTDGKILAESLMTQASFDKFTAYSVKGDEKWTFDAKYGAKMSGYADGASHENEDWFITPALNLEGKTEVKIKFDHARGPESSMNVGMAEGWYKVLVSTDYTEGDPTVATWTEVEGVNHGTVKWSYISSGELSLPVAALKANARVAFKYICSSAESATWEIKNVEIW
ncbi:MAG: choice-of-anchor J domain-containing protein [Paludibacteraceae bacterium]|nr:choice-of-anchor J domain-containing protein [Paludibacteraceae bacterium]